MSKGNEQIIGLSLLDKGADFNAQVGMYSNAVIAPHSRQPISLDGQFQNPSDKRNAAHFMST